MRRTASSIQKIYFVYLGLLAVLVLYNAYRATFAPHHGFDAARERYPNVVRDESPSANPRQKQLTDRSLDINLVLHRFRFAAPAVEKDGIYVAADTGWFYKFGLDEKLQWQFRAADAIGGALAKPLLQDSTVIFTTLGGRVYCLDKASGQFRWMMNLNASIERDPAVSARSIFYAGMVWRKKPEGALFSVDRESGELNWTLSLPQPPIGSPLVDENGTAISVLQSDLTLSTLNTQTGALLWSHRLPERPRQWYAAGNRIIALYNNRVTATPFQSGAQVWTISFGHRSSVFDKSSGTLFLLSPNGNALGRVNVASGEFAKQDFAHIELANLIRVVQYEERPALIARLKSNKIALVDLQAMKILKISELNVNTESVADVAWLEPNAFAIADDGALKKLL